MKTSLLICALLFIISTNLSWAHPPDNIEIELDSTGTILTINVSHFVNYPDKHYIASIIVKLNSIEMIKQIFKSQSGKEGTEVYYKLFDAKPDDKIEVTAQCNISGKLKETLVVPAEEQKDDQ